MLKKNSNNSELAILKAAETEFLEKGYDGARTVSIAERAGVTHSMLHYFFHTKEQLFERIVEEKFEQVSQSVLLIFGDASLPLGERLAKGIGLHFDFLAENPTIPLLMINEVRRIQHLIEGKVIGNVLPMATELQKEIDMDVRHLLLDILALNAFSILSMPITSKVFPNEESKDQLLERMKQENITVILKRLGL